MANEADAPRFRTVAQHTGADFEGGRVGPDGVYTTGMRAGGAPAGASAGGDASRASRARMWLAYSSR